MPVSAAEQRLFARHTARERSVAQRIWTDLADLPGRREQLRYVLVKLFPSPAYMMPRYQIRHWLLLPLYYLYHLGTGLASGLRLLLSRAGRTGPGQA